MASPLVFCCRPPMTYVVGLAHRGPVALGPHLRTHRARIRTHLTDTSSGHWLLVRSRRAPVASLNRLANVFSDDRRRSRGCQFACHREVISMFGSKTFGLGLRVSSVFSMLLAVSACNPGGDDSGDPSGYVGTWTYSDESTQTTCPTGDVTTGLSYPGGTLVVAQSAGGLAATDRDGCSATFAINGSTATAQGGQSCTTADGDTATIASWTIFVYGAQELWNYRTIDRTSSVGSACSVSIVASVYR